MIRAVIYTLLTFPINAFAAPPSNMEFNFFSSFIQMIAALSIVIGLILVTRHFSGKLLKGIIPAQQSTKHIRVVETRYLGPKKSLVLIEVGGEYLLLGSTENSFSLIKDVNIIEEIEVVEEKYSLRTGFDNLLRGKLMIKKEGNP